MRLAQEEPTRLKSEADKARLNLCSQSDAMSARIEAAEQLSLSWKEYSIERQKAEEQLNLAKLEYKNVLKRTEAAALSGQPRLYWFAKAMFAKLRRHSLSYQVFEAQAKLDALEASHRRLQNLVKNLRLETTSIHHLLSDDDAAQSRAAEHADQMADMWQREHVVVRELESWQLKTTELDIKSANAAAAFIGIVRRQESSETKNNPGVVHSEQMLTSRLAHIGFTNKTKLMTLVEEAEFAAEHAEKDLQKVRDGLTTAAQAAVDGKASRMSREWVDYCKGIVRRYFDYGTGSTTPS